MCELMKGKLIPSAVIKLLWEKFTMKVSDAIVGLSFRDPQFSTIVHVFIWPCFINQKIQYRRGPKVAAPRK